MKSYLYGKSKFANCVILLLIVATPAQAKKPDNPGGGGGATYNILAFEPFGAATPHTWVTDVNELGVTAVGGAELPSGEYQSACLDITTGAYTTFDVGTEITAVNNHNQLVGSIGGMAAFWGDLGADPLLLPPLIGNTMTFPNAINDNGIVLGISQLDENRGIPVVWRVNGQGANGLVVEGPYVLPTGEIEGYKFGLNELKGGIAQATGHSQSGAVVWSIETDAQGHLIPPTLTKVLGALHDPTWASGLGINNNGEVAGLSDSQPFFAAADGTLEALPVPHKAIDGAANDINDAGQIVGRIAFSKPNSTAPVNYDAVLWNGGEPVLLKSLIEPQSGWDLLTGAHDVTANGVIAGGGRLDNLQGRGFLMIPNATFVTSTASVPEPTSVVLFGLGLLTFLAVIKRSSTFLVCHAVAMLIAVSFVSATTYAAEFIPLGDLAGGEFNSQAWSVSAHGSVVVGRSFTDRGVEAFRWTHDEGMRALEALPIGTTTSEAYGITSDGGLIVGRLGSAAVRWSDDLGWDDLGGAYQSAFGVSANGDVIVGGPEPGRAGEAWRWTQSSGMVGMGDLPDGLTDSAAWGASADGEVIVGYGTSSVGVEAFRWTESSGMVGLGDLPGGEFGSSAIDVSADGSVVVGYGTTSAGIEAMRWTEDGGMVGLGGSSSYARAVSGDGSVVVGVNRPASGNEAFVWDTNDGMRSLQQVLTDYGVDLHGWSLEWALDVSPDGQAIVGWGFNPLGQREAFLVRLTHVPEPSAVCLAILGVFCRIPLSRPRNRWKPRA